MTRFENIASSLTRALPNLGLAALMVLPVVTIAAGCQSQMTVGSDDSKLVSRAVTEGGPEAIYPDHAPAIPDGQNVWKQMNCAQCHGAAGSGGSAKVDLTSAEYMRKQKPVDQYMFLVFGKPGSDHPVLADRATRQQAWNLTFYVRSLATPLLATAEYEKVQTVFGANCAVCHGTKGFGDGPLNKYNVLEPNPANFQNYQRFFDRTDDVLWDHIANGIKWEGMPDFLGKEDKAKNVKFDQEYIWKLVAFVRQFHSTNQSTLAEAKVDTQPQTETK